jgi:nucleoside-diphosphate-sugar epimerase
VPRALILGGTGCIGRAVATRLLGAGWDVGVTGRNPENFPPELVATGGKFIESDRKDGDQLSSVFGSGVDLLVDCLCYTAEHALQLLPLVRDAGCTVMISAKAVYIDDLGNRSGSPTPPNFGGPIRETQPTVGAGNGDFTSWEGYGPNKVAAENVLLDSGWPVTVLRPSKVHGIGARPPREWVFVKRVLDGRPAVLLAHRGSGVDHPTAACNLAALVEVVAGAPGRRILNVADPDTPDALEISRTIARLLGYAWDEVLLDDPAPVGLGRTPWGAPHPIALDMTAAGELGYVPVGDYASTVGDEVEWLVSVVQGKDRVDLPPGLDVEFFRTSFDYAAEDEYLSSLSN